MFLIVASDADYCRAVHALSLEDKHECADGSARILQFNSNLFRFQELLLEPIYAEEDDPDTQDPTSYEETWRTIEPE